MCACIRLRSFAFRRSLSCQILEMTTVTEVTPEASQKLSLKGIEGDIDERHVGRLRPTHKETPLPELRERLREDGYLFIKHVIPRADVLSVRKRQVANTADCK